MSANLMELTRPTSPGSPATPNGVTVEAAVSPAAPKAITFTTFGGFGEGTHELIKEVTKDTDWSLNDPWVKPSPKSHAYLTFGFALARANARMLLHADSRRRSAKNRVRTTRPQSATS